MKKTKEYENAERIDENVTEREHEREEREREAIAELSCSAATEQEE